MEKKPMTYTIPDSLCYSAGVTGSWISANTIGVHAFKPVRYNHKDAPSQYSQRPTLIHHIRPEVVIFDPILRKLVNEANGIFLRVQQINETEKSTNKTWLNLSHQYRSIIRACLENLQEVEESNEKYSSYLTIFFAVECVWHLCEILYIDQIPGDVVLNPLLEWIRFHFPEHERNATNLLSGSLISGAEAHPKYWDTVIGVFMQGRIDIVRALLKLHTASDSVPFKIADNVLRIMPLYNVYGGLSANDFQTRWKHWQMDTQTKIDSKSFTTQKNLELMMKLSVGDKATWESEGMARCDTWYEFLASYLLYSEPFVRRSHLGPLATKCYDSWPTTNKHLDQTLLAIMQQDLHQVIHEIQQMSENGWFAAHITDLLYHCGALADLDTQKKINSHALRNSLIHDYGVILMSHHSLWQIGADYLSHSDEQGLRRLELLLERIPLKSEGRALKIIQVAQKYGFPHIVHSICKQQAMLMKRRNRPGHALAWALKSKDSVLAGLLADGLLKEYSENGTLLSTDLLDSLGASMLISDRLIFLGKYFEFHKEYKSRNFKEAANLLILLLSSKLTPKYFWGVLFTDALPLLECDDTVLNSNDTYEFLHCIEQNCSDPRYSDQIELIRLAAARNLARALVHEIQSTVSL